jgi:energy-coupling factor transporter ATP-binding protein EcfA2
MKELFRRIHKNKVVALIGNSKNSGKTTTLNYLLENFKNAGVITIGLDGEAEDLIYGTFKPKVHLFEGQYVCTFANELTSNFEIIDKLDFKDLYIAKTLTECDISIVNPGGREEIIKTINKMSKWADVIFIDGAFDRIFSLSS